MGAKRVAIDNVEALFAAFSRPSLVRSELQRLFRWLRDHELTTVIAAGPAGAGAEADSQGSGGRNMSTSSPRQTQERAPTAERLLPTVTGD